MLGTVEHSFPPPFRMGSNTTVLLKTTGGPGGSAKIARSGSAATASIAHWGEGSVRRSAHGAAPRRWLPLNGLIPKEYLSLIDGTPDTGGGPQCDAPDLKVTWPANHKIKVLGISWSVSCSGIDSFFERKARVTPAQIDARRVRRQRQDQSNLTRAQYHMVVTDLQHPIGEKGEHSTFSRSGKRQKPGKCRA
jgi:hypothetical protein